ncbi:uncharacterized protein EV154DRAFT_492258 [Mucor mucedo]|uniref:uncharacterized protein n=1 Tax=Mucor mucedo TaxID=29922 RepID=UPI00222123E2|nr:uncharacterized protein EV154DRAFT_492258 [Mucor mucedo]KAI7896449.1 hypothetical protein EV154DRAFT_492258 [Mucor mucedo]
MKLTLIAATCALVASAMAQGNSTVIPSGGMGGTVASASISVDTPANPNAANQLAGGFVTIALTSVAAAYALI